jgi:hypothetical protein
VKLKKVKTNKKCKFCKKKFLDITNNQSKIYCSKQCSYRQWYKTKGYLTRKKYNISSKENRKRWKENYYKKREIILIRKHDRDNIKKDECHICKSKINLEIHHLSYKPSIYIILCYNCHLKEHGKVKRK